MWATYFSKNRLDMKGKKEKCFAFDFAGEFLKEFASIADAARHYGMNVRTVYYGMKRKSIIANKLYFMPTKVFVRPIKKNEHNPLYRKGAPYGAISHIDGF